MTNHTLSYEEAAKYLGLGEGVESRHHVERLIHARSLQEVFAVSGKAKPIVHEEYEIRPIGDAALNKEFTVWGPAITSSCERRPDSRTILTVRPTPYLRCLEFADLPTTISAIENGALELSEPLRAFPQEALLLWDDVRKLENGTGQLISSESIHHQRYQEAVEAALSLVTDGLHPRELTWPKILDRLSQSPEEFPTYSESRIDRDSIRKSIARVGNPGNDNRVKTARPSK